MENLAPSLKMIIEIKKHLLQGISVHLAIKKYTERVDDDLSLWVEKWLLRLENGEKPEESLHSMPNLYRRALFQLFILGLEGRPIYSHLCEMEKELLELSYSQMELTLAKLPFRLLLPLLLLQFPAFLILLLGPLLKMIFTQIGGK